MKTPANVLNLYILATWYLQKNNENRDKAVSVLLQYLPILIINEIMSRKIWQKKNFLHAEIDDVNNMKNLHKCKELMCPDINNSLYYSRAALSLCE